MKNIEYLKHMLLSGVNNLHNNYPHIDKLNVFPVPDGDTGTNMNLTVTNGYKNIADNEYDSIYDLLTAFARGLILGARGNSGVIFSQIMKGLSVGMKDAKDLSITNWKLGLQSAVKVAYKAVMNPVEGTILTVIRETSENADKLDDSIEIPDFWKKVVEFAKKSLENTPNLLPALKEANVVDSGGYGLVKFLEGMEYFVSNGDIIKEKKTLEVNNGGNIDMKVNQEFGYCTEAIVILSKQAQKNINVNEIRQKLESLKNNSMVVVVDDDILKVHTHALEPGQVLNYLQSFGDFKNIKIENMTLQSDRQVKGGNPNITSAWHETSAVATERKLANKNATIAVVQSDEQKEYFENEIGVNFAINAGSKMNPSTKDFLEAIQSVDAKNVFILPNNSNVILTANQSKDEETKSKVIVIPTKTVQQGMTSALSFDPEGEVKDNTESLTSAISEVLSFTISQAAKDSVVDGVDVKNGEQMAIVNGKIVKTESDVIAVFKDVLTKYINKDSEIVTVFTGQDATDKDIETLKELLATYPSLESEIVDGGQKVYSFLIAVE